VTTDELITALRDRGIDPAVALDLFVQWLGSTTADLRKKRRYNDAEYLDYLGGYLHGQAERVRKT
jgi:hypothetical protein